MKVNRRLQGCYYFGCFTPFAFTVIALMIAANTLRRPFHKAARNRTDLSDRPASCKS